MSLTLFIAFGMANELPACRFDDLLTEHHQLEDWQRSLLDTIYQLPESYTPTDLVSTTEAGLAADLPIRAIVLDDLKALVETAEQLGHPIEVQSAYRSYDYQQRTFQYWVDVDGLEVALRTSARAGHSEHQLGTALDFRSKNGPPAWDLADWGETPAGAWMIANSWRFGFVLSYPQDKEVETCYSYEPWHYRYLGRELAKEVHESGLSLRAWLWQLAQEQPE